MTKKQQHELTIQNVGAIAHIVIPLSDDGGVTIFKGPNGSGKSTGLEAVSTLVSGRGKRLPLRDGQKQGLVSGFGSTINLKLSGSRRGGEQPQLIVDSIEGKFSIDKLVNPEIQNPESADKARIKALITLTGVDATPDLFVSLFDTKEEFEKIVSRSSVETSDPAELTKARQAVDALREKQDLSAVAKENKRKKGLATEALHNAEAIKDYAVSLRETARNCDVILTELIGADSPLRVINGRMVVSTKRGKTSIPTFRTASVGKRRLKWWRSTLTAIPKRCL